jgi:hypothetical protein
MNGSTNLVGAILADACLSEDLFEGATYDANTVFPIGFDPLAHGMKQQ